MQPDFADVYDDHIWDVYGFFAYRLASRQEAEDLTQGTFERALRAWGRYDPARSKPRTWLLSIANNLLIDHFRSDRSDVEEPVETVGDHGAVAGAAPGPEDRLGIAPELATALAALGERERVVIALRFGGDLTGQEIADILDLSLANVQQILSRSLRQLRRLLEPTAQDVDA